MQTIDIEKYLYFLTRPGRYTDNELNTKQKRISEKFFNIALAFPDLYEVGMSHLGLKTLYSIINSQDTLAADRVYTPDYDLIELLKEKSIPLFSIEDKVPLKEFDLVGFTLQYELSCTNILLMLELGEIPILSEDRTEKDPIIIAGGPGAFNPEPLSLFIDAFVIGDGEDVILEIAELLNNHKSTSRGERLYLLTQVEGVYVPSFYTQDKDETGISIHRTQTDVPEKIKRRFFTDFNNPEKMHSPQLMPIVDIVHRRPAFEIMRGCSRGCRFCQAGMIYRPVRERDSSLIEKQINKDIETNGWEEISLNSLSTSDYTAIQPLLSSLMCTLPESNIKISLPSLRIDTVEKNFQPQLAKILGKTITLAPEAGSQRLRDSINKNLSEEDILTSVRCALDMGIRSIKLYFMAGLPGESEDDIQEIISLIEKMYAIQSKKISQINVSIAPFVPKPHTPFQWCRQDTIEEFLHKVSLVKHHFSKQKKIKIKYHTLEQSKLEAVIARGDRDVSKVIYSAYKTGALFDSWNSSFDYSLWEQAAKRNNVNFNTYWNQIPVESSLPWDHIDAGITKDFLKREYKRSKEFITTEDCRTGACSSCGICENLSPLFCKKTAKAPVTLHKKDALSESEDNRFLYKVVYDKGDKMRFISHKELSVLIYTIMRKSALPVYYTKGFNRHPKISFGPPLSLGMAGRREVFSFSTVIKLDEKEIRKKLDVNLPKDFVINEVINISSSRTMNFTEELIRITSHDSSINWQKIIEFQNIYFYSERKNKEFYINKYFWKVKMLTNGVDIHKKLGLNIFEILDKAFHFSNKQIGNCYIERIELY